MFPFLREEVKRLFPSPNMESAEIYFQKFDEEWGDYVEVEEDAVVTNRDKLTVTINFITSSSAGMVCVIYGFLHDQLLLPRYLSPLFSKLFVLF